MVAVIALLNSALILSSIFPAWLISRELGISRKGRLIVLAITVFYPDMMLPMTFMSENLYWPLVLWIFYVWLRNFKTPKISYTILFSVVSYIAYLCKEIALAFPLTCLCFGLIFPAADHLLGGDPEHKKLDDSFIENIEPGSSVRFCDIKLKYPVYDHWDSPAESFEYIIVENVNVNMYGKSLSNVELIEEISNPELSVYKNNDIYSISFTEE